MAEAILLAQKAGKKGEVPIGAVVVCDQKIVGRGFNVREKKKNAILHAEILAILKACKKMKDWRLENAQLYVTLQPCMMCLGACLNARIGKVVFGAFDPKNPLTDGVVSSLNHNLVVEGGVCEAECKQLLKDFFEKRRKENKKGSE